MADSTLGQMPLEDLLALRQQLQGQRTDLQGRIVAKSRELGVDPALALSTAHVESMFDPQAVSPRGVTGLFQVTVPTGQRYGQTPENRTDPDVSIHAGVSELKRLLDANGGDMRKALKGYGDPKQGNYADLVLAQYPRYAPLVQGVQQAQQGQPPALDQMSMEDLVRLRDTLRGAAPAPVPAAAPEALPEVVPSADPTQPATLRMPTSQGEAGLPMAPTEPTVRGGAQTLGEQPSDIVIDIEKPSPAGAPSGPGQYTPEELLQGTGFRPLGEQFKELGAMGVQGVTTAAGGVVGAMGGPAAPATIPLGMMLGSYYGHRLSQQLGLTPGTPQLLPQTLPDYLALALPGVVPAAQGALRLSRAGRALTQAQQETAAAQGVAQEQYAAQLAQRRQAIADRERKAAAELSTAEDKARTGTQADHAAWLQKMQQYNQEVNTLRQAEVQAVQEYQAAVQGQAAARQQAQSIPQRYAPPRPPGAPRGERVSKYYYDQFDQQYGQVPIDLTPSASLLQAVRTDVELSLPSMRPPRLQKALDDLEALGPSVPASRLYEIMKDVGTVTRDRNRQISGPAKRLFGELSDAMRRSAPTPAQDALNTAKQTWMQEEGVASIQKALGRRKGATIIKEDPQGRLVLNVPRLRELVTDPDYLELQKWLPSAEYQALDAETRAMLGTPAMPKGPLPPPPGTAVPTTPIPQMSPPREVGPVGAVPWSPPPTFQQPPPVEPTLQPPALRRLSAESLLPFLASLAYGHAPQTAAALGLGIAGGDLLSHGLAKVMLSPMGRPLLEQAMKNGGRISPELATMIGAFAAEVGSRVKEQDPDKRRQFIEQLIDEANQKLQRKR